MEAIHFRSVLPMVFEHQTGIESEIWNQDVTFEKGRLYLVEADSGKGKSTFCSYVVGFRRDYKGSVLFDERNVASFTKSDWVDMRLYHISHLFQELRLFPELTALENVQIKNNLTGFKSAQEIETMLDSVMAPEKKHQPVRTLSLGQRQRVAAVRALCQPFEFLLMDEPFSHLDNDTSRKVADMILREVQAQDAGMIVTALDKTDIFPFDVTLNL